MTALLGPSSPIGLKLVGQRRQVRTGDRHIRLRGWSVSKQISPEILDEGPGIPEIDLARIFDKFYRVQKGDHGRAGTSWTTAIRKGRTMIWRYVPAAGIALMFVIACLRPLLQQRWHGALGIALFSSRDVGANIRDLCLVGLALVVAGQAVAAAVWPQSMHLLVTDADINGLMQGTGAIVLLAGIALVAIAQLDLGASWRIGIDEHAKPGLVTGGLYRFSRNPIYLGVLMTIAGETLLLPTLLSLVLLAGAYVGVRMQTSAEEAYLLRTYGDAYRDYARNSGRFLPGIGRL